MKKLILLGAASLFSVFSFAQVTPQPSPGASVSQTVGINKISVEYSRPGVKGRAIFGGLIPFGKVWRTGANSSTKIETSGDITVQGQVLKAGKYAILSIPAADEWTVIFSKDLGVSEQSYKEADDVLRVKATPSAVAATESFTIDFSDVKDDNALLNFSWEKTKVSLTIGVNNEAAINEAVTKKNAETAGALSSAAEYMLNKGMDVNKALTLVEQSIALKETFRNLWVKAQLLDKLGKPAEALALATKAQTLGAADPVYQFFKDGIEKGITTFKTKIPLEAAAPVVPSKKKKN